ncbi:MAG: hypothetical protein KKA73_08585 [Chloroflexi bacterium]|nr:hypothetical protein [Chloroflexota bacterium]MBU1747733.1 hypothetical protein [Chloroflexota bacterium]MBU1879047.1 hypothetical protein [Chloroflexota bacterium]
MTKPVIIHFLNEDPIRAEMEELPSPSDSTITFMAPRKLDGKPIPYITAGAVSFIFPWHRISFLEVMTSEEERREVVDFFRE